MRICRKKFKLSYDGGNSGMQTRLWWRLWWNLAESAFGGSLESGGQFCVGEFGRNLGLITLKMFSHLIQKEIL
jgi:hypothetical protein